MYIISRFGYDLPNGQEVFIGILRQGWGEWFIDSDFDKNMRSYMAKKQKQKKEHQNKFKTTDGSKMSKPAPKQKKKKK